MNFAEEQKVCGVNRDYQFDDNRKIIFVKSA